MGEEFERVVELPHGSWQSLKAHLTGGLGELFALIWLAQRKVPEGEVWGLRRGFEHGRAGPLWSPSVEPATWREFSFPARLLLDVMAPPGHGSLFGLPGKAREWLKPLFSAWVPRGGEEGEVARLLLAFMEEHPGWPWWSLPPPRSIPPEERLAAEVGEAARRVADQAELYIVVSPASEFRALPLLFEACRAGDFALLKWSTLRRLEVEEVEKPRVFASLRPVKRAKASWVVEVEPPEATARAADKLRKLLSGAAELRWRESRLYVYGQIGEEELEKALKRACAEAQAELEHHLRFLKGKDYSRVLGFAPREGVEVWEGELEGVEVVEVKTGAGRLSKPQEYALESLRREAEKAREALGRRVEVSYRVVRVELEGLELPERAHITTQSMEL